MVGPHVRWPLISPGSAPGRLLRLVCAVGEVIAEKKKSKPTTQRMKNIRTALLGVGLVAWMGMAQPAKAQWPVSGIMAVKNANTGGPVYLATVANDFGEVATDVRGQFWALMYPSEHFQAFASGYYATDKYLTLAECNNRYAEIAMPPTPPPPPSVGQEHLVVAAPVLGLLSVMAARRRRPVAGNLS